MQVEGGWLFGSSLTRDVPLSEFFFSLLKIWEHAKDKKNIGKVIQSEQKV